MGLEDNIEKLEKQIEQNKKIVITAQFDNNILSRDTSIILENQTIIMETLSALFKLNMRINRKN